MMKASWRKGNPVKVKGLPNHIAVQKPMGSSHDMDLSGIEVILDKGG